jgi:hypothetical protein
MEISQDAEEVGSAFHIAAKADRETKRPPKHRGPTHGNEALDHYGQHILASDQAAVEEGQARRHQHDEAGAEQHESRVSGVDR